MRDMKAEFTLKFAGKDKGVTSEKILRGTELNNLRLIVDDLTLLLASL